MTHVLTEAELDAAGVHGSCGPASLAAVLGKSIADVRGAFQRGERQAWTNVKMMKGALDAMGVRWTETVPRCIPRPDGAPSFPAWSWPETGLALIQFQGPWDSMHADHPAQLERSHWIACGRFIAKPDLVSMLFVFEVNMVGSKSCPTGWVPRTIWESTTAPLLAEGYRRANGRYWVRAAYEVSR